MAPLFFGCLLFLLVMLAFVALWRTAGRRDPVEARLRQYGISGEIIPGDEALQPPDLKQKRLPLLTSLVNGFGLGPWLARALSRADLQITAAEFALVIIGAAGAGFLAGTYRWGPAGGLGAGLFLGCMPVAYLLRRGQRRALAFTDQLPEVLTLMVGGLRAGQGLTQSLQGVAEQLQPPAREEFRRVLQSVELGLSVEQALNNLAEHFDTTDLDMLVTAINVQYQAGGNLAQTLDIIGETIRDRIRLKRQLRTLTAQQRLTGYVLTAMPILVAGLMFSVNPEYMMQLFQPGWVRLLLPVSGVMMVAGFLLIRKILEIEV